MKTANFLAILSFCISISVNAQITQQQNSPILKLEVDANGTITLSPISNKESIKPSQIESKKTSIMSSPRISTKNKASNYINRDVISLTQPICALNLKKSRKVSGNHTETNQNYRRGSNIDEGIKNLVSKKLNNPGSNIIVENLISNETSNLNQKQILLKNIDNTPYTEIGNEPKANPNLFIYLGDSAIIDYNFNDVTNVLDIYTSIANNGSSFLDQFYVGFYLSTNTTLTNSDEWIARYNFKLGLPSFYYQNISVSVDLDFIVFPNAGIGNVGPGTYYIFMKCDDGNMISESDETDNVRYFIDPITNTIGTPNLSLYDGEGADNSYWYDNETKLLYLHASILNNGTGNASDFEVGFYLSNDYYYNASDMLIAQRGIYGLGGGSYTNTEASANLDEQGISAGTYYIIIVSDNTGLITESDENDNYSYFIEPFTYTSPNSVNLFVYSGDGSNNSYTYYDATKQLDVNASIANGGNSEIVDTFLVAFCLSMNEVLDTNDIFIGFSVLSQLQAGYFAPIEISSILSDWELKTGTYYLYIICDFGNFIDETDETDNVEYFIDPIIYTEPNETNLFVFTGDGSYNAYEFNNTTHLLNISTTITSVGNLAATNFRVGFYLSDDLELEATDILITAEPLSYLAEGLYADISTGADLDNFDLASGSYYIIIYCDDLFQVTETDETDNGVYFEQSITYTPAEVLNICIYKGKEAHNTCDYNASTHVLQISASIENVGNSTAKNFRIGLYLSNDATIKTTDTFLDDVTISSLENGKYKNIEFSVDLDNFSIANGIYHIGVLCDDLNKIDEATETDNGYCFTQTIEYNATSLAENIQGMDFIVYPNPTMGKIVIILNEKLNSELIISILGFNGQELEKYVLPTVSKEKIVEFDLSSYRSGIYFIHITNSNVSTIKKVIKI